MKIDQMKSVEVDAKTLKIHLKVCDQFTAELVDQDGETIHEQDEGYVPGFMPGEHYGDYVILDVDIDTGQILNWNEVSPNDISEWINGPDE